MIKIMCNEKEVGAYADLAYTKQVSSYNPGQVIYCREFAEGAVVAVREMNGYDDSDFYATFYNVETGCFEEFCYGTTRFWTYPCTANIDATPEIKALYEVFKAEKMAAYQAAKEAAYAATPSVGKAVKIQVSRGKNAVLNGKVGEVFWYGVDKYRVSAMRVGVMVEGLRYFFSTSNVIVL